MKPARSIVVCADDAGWDASNDERILAHARAGEVSAVSVLVDGTHAPAWANADLGDGCAVGLHLSLTWSPERGSHGLASLLVAAHGRSLDTESVRMRLQRQLSRFEHMLGRPPDFVDGHQHVQILPGVRDVLLELLRDRYGSFRPPAVRLPLARRWRGAKAAGLGLLGARSLAHELRARSWPANRDFAGTYDLSEEAAFGPRMRRWLDAIEDRGLIMVHPGGGGLAEHDAARVAESAYLASDDWRRDRRDAGIRLIPFSSTVFSESCPR